MARPSKLGRMKKVKTVWVLETPEEREQITDYYKLLDQVGEPGQYGKALRCRHKVNGEIFIAKEISKDRLYRLESSSATREYLLECMKDEINIMRRFKHPYIVRMYETFETKQALYIVMEECKGGELFERLQKKRRFSEQEAITVIRKICKALMYMHDTHRVVHCDIKPDNILMVDESDESDIKLIDFGMSKVLPRLRSLNTICGTPYYTAPEVLSGKYSYPADMWSVGVITFLLIFGFPPFYNSSSAYGMDETKIIYKLICQGFDPTFKPGYGAWFPKSLKNLLSEDGADFIKNLLASNVADRLTAKEALEHPWLNLEGNGDGGADGGNDAASLVPRMSGSDISEFAHLQFLNFASGKKFKFAVSALFRSQYESMRPKHFQNLKRLFNELDEDKNGKISYKEFEEGMLRCRELELDPQKIRAMFEELDVNKMGEIDFVSLLNAAVHDYLIASDLRLYRAFRDLDETDSGKIRTEVLKRKVAELDPYGNVDDLLAIIDGVDLDKDGYIDYEEFLRALHPDFNEQPKWLQASNEDQSDDNDEDEEEEEWGDEQERLRASQKHDDEKKSPGDDPSILKAGFLRKQGKMVKSWKRRWFVLRENGVMSYYYDNTSTTPVARFDCKQCTELKPRSWSKNNQRRFGVKVYTPARNWKLLCMNNKERMEWIAVLEKVTGKKAMGK